MVIAMKDEDAKQLYMEYKLLSEQLKKVQQYLEKTSENLSNIGDTISSLEEFSKLKKGAKIFAPFANGIFVDATLNDASHVRMNVGGHTVVTKSVDEAKKMMEAQRDEVREMRDRANADLLKLTQRLKEIEASIEG